MRAPLEWLVLCVSVSGALLTGGCFMGALYPPPDSYELAVRSKCSSLPNWTEAYEHGRYDVAIAALSSATALDEWGRYADWVLSLGKAQLLAGCFEDALASFARYRQLHATELRRPYPVDVEQIRRLSALAAPYEREARLLHLQNGEPSPAITLFGAYAGAIKAARFALAAELDPSGCDDIRRGAAALDLAAAYPTTFEFSREFARHVGALRRQVLGRLLQVDRGEYEAFVVQGRRSVPGSREPTSCPCEVEGALPPDCATGGDCACGVICCHRAR